MIMKSTRVLIVACVAALVLIISDRKVEACSCQPMHPQDLFCRSDFVIKARIRKVRMVELKPNGTFRKMKLHRPKEVPDSSETWESVEASGVHEAPPAPHHGLHNTGISGSDLRMLDHSKRHEEPSRVGNLVNPVSDSGHERSEPSGNESKRRKRNSMLIPLLPHSPSYGRGPPGIHEIRITPRSTIMTQYRVSISKIYKGLQNFTETQLKFLYTPPAPLCDARLPINGSPFILMGTVHEGILLVRQCDYKIELTKLVQEQHKNAIRNMEHRYPAACQQCRVEVCNHGACEGEKEPFQCRWREWWSTKSPYSSQFVCVPKKNGKCGWYNAVSKEIQPDDIDEWTR